MRKWGFRRQARRLFKQGKPGHLGIPPQASEGPRAHARVLRNREVTRIVDIGANAGETVTEYLHLFPQAHIDAFEPVPKWTDVLTQRFGDNDRVTVHATAMGAEAGTLRVNIAVGPKRSSFRRPAEGRGDDTDPMARIVETREVHVDTLDAFVARHALDRIDLLKVDVEGFEREVLAGAAKTLSHGLVGLIGMEMRFVESFSGEALFDELYQQLRGHGFELVDIAHINRLADGSIGFLDAVFLCARQTAVDQS